MNFVDGLLILIIIPSVWGGYQRGFILGIMELLSWLGSLVLTFMYYPYAVKWIEEYLAPQSIWTTPLAFILTFFILRIIAGFIVRWILSALPAETHENFINKLFGMGPGLVNGLIYAAIIATLLLIVPVSDKLSAVSRESQLASRLTEPIPAIEEKLSPIFNEAVRRTIGRITVEPESNETVKLPFTVTHPKVRPDLEAKMLELVNKERVTKGLTPLKADPEMAVVARKHSVDMFARGYFSHNTPEKKDPFDRMRRENVQFLTAGENLALARTLNMAHEGLMNSPSHRANILQPAFGRVGIGIMDGGIYGLMVTQNFRN
jgi:uncharacterized protein YkwD